ncbi:MAG: winged helix-turn-helix transcriptional regulator [Clostridiales bacterium]|nr:winged helix-turn-helix transcriptional regulator [Clostridiales bacterium]
MEMLNVLKAISEENRMKILNLLLKHNYCVRALSTELNISEAAVSQHIKVLKEAGLLKGEKKGHYMHYDVNREVLNELAKQIEEMASIKKETCKHKKEDCKA